MLKAEPVLENETQRISGDFQIQMKCLFIKIVAKMLWTSNISTLNGSSLELVDKFTYLGSSVSSTETDIDRWLTKAWTAINMLSVIWKSDLTDKMKHGFFQAAIWKSYGSQTWPIKWNTVSFKQRSCRYCYMDALHGR